MFFSAKHIRITLDGHGVCNRMHEAKLSLWNREAVAGPHSVRPADGDGDRVIVAGLAPVYEGPVCWHGGGDGRWVEGVRDTHKEALRKVFKVPNYS